MTPSFLKSRLPTFVCAFAISAPLFAAAPAPAPDGGAYDSQKIAAAETKILQNEIAVLQKALADSKMRCDQLTEQNAALLKRLGDAATAEVVTGRSATCWENGCGCPTTERRYSWNHAEADLAGWRIDRAKEVAPGHLTLLATRISKGLGTDVRSPIGTLWIENQSLKFQWTDSDPAAMDAFKYSTVEIQDATGRQVKSLCFWIPMKPAISVRRVDPLKIDIPGSLAAKVTLKIPNAPSGWQVTNDKDGQLVLTNGGAIGRIKYDAAIPGVSVKWTGEYKSKLDALNDEYKNEQNQIAALKNKVVGATYAAQRRYIDQIESLTQQMDETERSISMARYAAPERDPLAALAGTVIDLELPNGIVVGQITMQDR